MTEYVDNGGVRLAVNHDGEGPDVLFAHGLSGSDLAWADIIPSLTDRYRCWTLDMRGHGHSDRAPGTYTVDNYAADIAAVLDHIGKPTVLAGHSLGGISTAHLATQGHPLLRAVYLEDPPLFLGTEERWNATVFAPGFPIMHKMVSDYQTQGRPVADYEQALGDFPSLAGGTARDHTIPTQLHGHAIGLSQMDPDCWLTAMDLTLFDALDPEPAIAVPVRVAVADPALGPAFCPGDDALLLKNTPHAEFFIVEGAGHLLHMAIDMDGKILTDLTAFLQANT